MNDTQSLGWVGAAAAAPALGPSLAAVAPPLLLGAGLVAALVWLLREDEDKPKTTPAAPDHGPAGAASRQAHSPNGQHQERIVQGENQIARQRREVERLRADMANRDRAVAAARAGSREARVALPCRSVTTQTSEAPRAALREAGTARLAPPGAGESVAPAPSGAAPLTPKPSPSGAVPAPGQTIPHPVPPPAPAPAESPGPAPITRGAFPLVAAKVNREDLAAIFREGQRLTRKAAVAALVARGIAKSTAYQALRPDGRFADVLAVGEDGLLAFQG